MKTLGEMIEDEQNALFRAKYIHGKVIEFASSGGEWRTIYHPAWEPNLYYRVKPEPPASINWDHVDEKIVKLAYNVGWRLSSYGGLSIPANVFSSFKPGDVDTVVYRPGNGACQATVIG